VNVLEFPIIPEARCGLAIDQLDVLQLIGLALSARVEYISTISRYSGLGLSRVYADMKRLSARILDPGLDDS
jgi:hypothetical protein